MTIGEYIASLEKKLAAITRADEALFIAASDTHSKQSKRIFEEGKAADGSDIGQYDAITPLYVDPNKAPVKFAPKGKTGKTKFEDGRTHKTGYFESYRAFRTNQRKPVDKVNLELFGRLKSDFAKAPRKDNNNSYITGVTDPENRKKAIGNQYRFRKAIFSLSQEERENFTDVMKLELNRIINA